MRITETVAIVVLSALSAAAVDAGEYTSMDSLEQRYFTDVATTCAADVQRLCTPVESDRRMVAGGLQNDSQNPIEQHHFMHLNSIIDDFHREALQDFDMFFTSFIRPQPQWVVVFDSSEEQQRKPPCPKHAAAMAAAAKPATHEDHILRNMAINFHPTEFDFVTKRLQAHGNELLNNDSLALTETGRRMARRLSEVSTEEMKTIRNSFLPFSEKQNECLTTKNIVHKLSVGCQKSLLILRGYRYKAAERLRNDEMIQYDTFFYLMMMYVFMMTSVFVMAYRNKKRAKRDMRLQESILSAVYSNPVLKRQVELKIGESAGSVPPYSPQVLMERAKRLRKGARLHHFLLFVGLWLVYIGGMIVNPIYMLQLIVAASAAICVYTTFVKKYKEPICTCCCCGTTTEMARLGLTSSEQACCGCCQGTGVCNVKCASCCGPDDDKDSISVGCCCSKKSDSSCCNCCGKMDCCCNKTSADGKVEGCCGCCGNDAGCCCCGKVGGCCGKDAGCCCCCGKTENTGAACGCCGQDVGCCCCGKDSSCCKKAKTTTKVMDEKEYESLPIV